MAFYLEFLGMKFIWFGTFSIEATFQNLPSSMYLAKFYPSKVCLKLLVSKMTDFKKIDKSFVYVYLFSCYSFYNYCLIKRYSIPHIKYPNRNTK